ncbi:putative fatty acid elongation protein 3 [Nephila pilipes]|uniref:Elongation of very long chain fatty acids protein n=1 Tax=Nephila pilipes TaxID=299642 RepID=A0A8X6PFX3_NEPPI|nr:putative fatty acid elongation protein 3 [Nephila pilipes]
MNTPTLFSETEKSPKYSFYFSFEKNFDAKLHQRWVNDHWHQAFYIIALYLITIFGIRAYMQTRHPFCLQKPLIVWNVFLAAFSIIGTSRVFPELVHALKKHGFIYSVCNPDYVEIVRVSGFWSVMFSYSKALELGDTIFIVLRKKPFIFLHWYHHITTLLFTWYCHKDHTGPGRWYINMNYFVHSLMYSYYALKAMRFRVPRFLSICITFVQTIQMLLGFYIGYFAYITKRKEGNCRYPDDTALFGHFMFTSYFLLFIWYFYKAYISPPVKTKKED